MIVKTNFIFHFSVSIAVVVVVVVHRKKKCRWMLANECSDVLANMPCASLVCWRIFCFLFMLHFNYIDDVCYNISFQVFFFLFLFFVISSDLMSFPLKLFYVALCGFYLKRKPKCLQAQWRECVFLFSTKSVRMTEIG